MRLSTIALVLAIAPGQSRMAGAAEITVLCSNGIGAVMEELVPRFEQTTRHTVRITYGVSAALRRQIAAGERFDVAVLTASLIDEAIEQGAIAAATRVVIARSAIVLAIQSGRAKAGHSNGRSARAHPARIEVRDLCDGGCRRRVLHRARPAAWPRGRLQNQAQAGANRRRGQRLGRERRRRARRAALERDLPVAGVEVLGPFPTGLEGYMVMAAGQQHGHQTGRRGQSVDRIPHGAGGLIGHRAEGMERPTP